MKSKINIIFCLCLNIIFNTEILNSQNINDKLVIKKCICRANEVQSRLGCEERDGPKYVQIWNETSSENDILDLNSLSVIVKPLQCPDNTIIENKLDWAFISPDGKLLSSTSDGTYLYCIENVVNDAGKVFQRFEKCMGKSTIHLCCDLNEYLDSSGKCTKISSSSMRTIADEWLSNFHTYKANIYCEHSERFHETFSFDMSVSELNHVLQHDQLANGTYCIGMYGDENELYPGLTYCNSVDRNLTNIRLCCNINQAFDIKKQECIPYDQEYIFPRSFVWPSNGARTTPKPIKCFDNSFILGENIDNQLHYFMPNGSMYVEYGKGIRYDEYCLGIIINNNETFHSGLACFSEEVQPCSWRWDIYRVLLGISSFFLVITLIVYIGVSELRRRIGGVCLISELFALLVSQITLIVIQTSHRNFSASGCLAAGIIEIIFVLASFFWLNIMCYDVWTTFRVLRPYSEKVFRTKLFLKYSLYGWGVPIVIGIIALILELTDSNFKPNFSPESAKCYFTRNDVALQWLYIYGIILILILINLFFFIHLASKLFSNQNENKKYLKGAGSNRSNSDMENLRLHGKLFFIMGLPWILEVFTSFGSLESECYIWVLDLFNMLRGVFIFIIFVCKKSTRDMLMAAWFPSYISTSKPETSESSRKTSTMSLSSWLPSIHGRKISKVSMTSGGHINLEALKEEEANPEVEEQQKN